MAEGAITGGCACGTIRYEAAGPPLWTALCHCESCRRACSAPVVAWMGFAAGSVRWRGKRRFRQSSEIGRRGFCPDCGSQLSFEGRCWPGEIHLTAVSRDHPDAFVADLHCHYDERLPCLHLDDALPKYPGSAGDPL